MNKSGSLSIFLVLLLTTACSQLPITPQSVTDNESRYIRNVPEKSKVIVFVHGVNGNATSSWTNEGTKSYWPDLIANDKAFADANVYVFEYPTPPFKRSPSVNELAEVMRGRLARDKVLSYPEIIFLSHSMGGLVTRAFLLKYREHASKATLIKYTDSTGRAL